MGIKHFFYWFKQTHGDCMESVRSDSPLSEQNVQVDVLALDLNGMFHTAAQKIFKYGNKSSTKSPRLLRKTSVKTIQQLRLDCFKEVCNIIDELVFIVQPKKRLLLCVDGVAGVSKCQQQRQRRFKSAKERIENDSVFDSCSITPGTKFMHYLNKYIDWHIHHQCNSGEWTHLDVIFSSEKVQGEGEHKCKQLFTKYCEPSERMMIYGLDADLIMLCLSTELPHIYVYRDNMYNSRERFIIDIGKFAKKIKQDLNTPSAVIDFIFMCFMVGNDFLPQIPGLEILSNGIESMIKIYKETCMPYGLIDPFTRQIRVPTLLRYFKALSKLELDALKKKYIHRKKYHEDELMETHFHLISPNEVECNFPNYKTDYYTKKLNTNNVQKACQEYIKGLQWVIEYYCNEIPSWTWFYPYNYAPFLDDLSECIDYKYIPYIPTEPLDSFEQLLAVLPPQSSSQLPEPLPRLMMDEKSPLYEYYPLQFHIDLSGKRTDWEGIAILPIMNISLLRQVYKDISKHIEPKDFRLNAREHTVRYKKIKKSYTWESMFGNISSCYITTEKLNIN